MKNSLFLSLFLMLSFCISLPSCMPKQSAKSAKSGAAHDRINASENSAHTITKELDDQQ